jgi:hypothetical protein
VSGKGFVSLSSLAGRGPLTRDAILGEIRTIYFKTTPETIHNDLAHAIELLKRLPDEEAREKATVYMEGLAQLRAEWGARSARKGKGQGSKGKSRKAGKPAP